MPSPSDIDKKQKQAIDNIQSKIADMSDVAAAIFLKALEDNFDFKSGKIVVENNFVKQLNRLTADVLDLLQKSPKFTGAVSGFLKRMPAISDAITEFQAATNDIKTPSFELTKKIVVDEITDQLLNNGLNQNFVQPLRDLIYQNVSSGGLTLSEARAQIKEFAKTTGKLGQYIEQTSIQAVDAYTGVINQKLLQTFDYDALLMTGSLIDTSSPQCKYVVNELGGKIKESDWPKVKAIAEKNGLIEGTTFDNLPVNKLHWGCRHSFYPIIDKKKAA